MKGVALVFILCLVIIGTVSADSIGMGPAQGIRVISTIDPHKISINQPQTSLMGMLSVTSTPSGASVMIDGSSTLNGAPIPVTNFNSLAILPGQHTITVKYAGYSDYSSSFSVNPGGTASVVAPLQRVTVMVKQQNPAVVSGAGVRNIEIPVASENTPGPGPTLHTALRLCPSGYTCETLEKAQSDYGADGYSQYSTLPCNYTGRALSKRQVPEFCILPKKKPVARISLNSNLVEQAGGVQKAGAVAGGANPQIKPVEPGHRLHLVEQAEGGQQSGTGESAQGSPIKPVKLLLPVAAIHSPPVITHVAVVDSFLDVVSSGIFGIFRPGSILAVNPGIQVQPISGGYIVAPVIGKDATIFIGEQGLDVTRALNEAYGSAPDGKPPATMIGWWASGQDLANNAPTKTVDLSTRYQNLIVSPSDFVGYTGNWYIVDSKPGSYISNGRVFYVADPSLDIRLIQQLDLNNEVDLAGKSVVRGTLPYFELDWNMGSGMGWGTDPDVQSRKPYSYSPGDGFIDIMMQDPSGKMIPSLEVTNRLTNWTESLQQECWRFTEVFDDSCDPSYRWDTAALDTNGQPLYPAGIYTFWAESHLNNMNNNYRNEVAPYTGHTISKKYTFSLVERADNSQPAGN